MYCGISNYTQLGIVLRKMWLKSLQWMLPEWLASDGKSLRTFRIFENFLSIGWFALKAFPYFYLFCLQRKIFIFYFPFKFHQKIPQYQEATRKRSSVVKCQRDFEYRISSLNGSLTWKQISILFWAFCKIP